MPTQPQIARLYSLSRAAGLSHDQVHGEIEARYGLSSTKELTPRWYEAYCGDLLRRARPAPRAVPPLDSSTPLLFDGNVRTAAACRTLLEAEWPELLAEHRLLKLADLVADTLDSFRLCRGRGAISSGILRTAIQRLRRCPYAVVEEACTLYLERYTSAGERYFDGICRRLKRATPVVPQGPRQSPASSSAGRPSPPVRPSAQSSAPPPPKRDLTPSELAAAAAFRQSRRGVSA